MYDNRGFGASSSAAEEYRADVASRGGAYILRLPANTNLKRSVLGFPGARFQVMPGTKGAMPNGLAYELAPWMVAAELLGVQSLVLYPWDQSGAWKAAEDDAKNAAGEIAGGIGDAVQDAAATVLGMPIPVALGVGVGLFFLLQPRGRGRSG